MRGQVFEIEGNKYFIMGGGYSIDKTKRVANHSWWSEEMPNEDEYSEAIENLKKNDQKVDYILSHAAPEETMNIFHVHHDEEKQLNNFLEWIRETTSYKRWFFGHLHLDEDLWRRQSCLFKKVTIVDQLVCCSALSRTY